MTEELLYRIWQHKLWGIKPLFTTNGEPIEVIHTGQRNADSGPDFSVAKLKIGTTQWVGNVEIHTHASDWKLHKHTKDAAYDSVILHVVYKNDAAPIVRSNGSQIPTLVLEQYVPDTVIKHYQHLNNEPHAIACAYKLTEIDALITTNWLERMALARLEQKYSAIQHILQRNTHDWEESFYQFLAYTFGFRVNALPFEMLAQTLPNKLLAKYKDNLLQLEALFFGQAGLLTNQQAVLQTEYQFLAVKHNLKPMHTHLWKFHRTRPQNFPDVRIAQLIGLVHHSHHLFSKVAAASTIKELQQLFTLKPYKSTYFAENTPKMGTDSLQVILINAVAVFLFAYGKHTNNQEQMDKALGLLDDLPAEKNVITRQFTESGLKIASALHSQAVLHLKPNYCAKKLCLNCAIGNKVLTLPY